MQFIFPPKGIALPVHPLLICAMVVLCWLAPRQVFADTATENTANTFTASMTDADCLDFINEKPLRVKCGFIDLPVNHDKPGSGNVTLPILIAGQTQTLSNTPSGKAILIPGGGGPGASIGFGELYLEGEYLSYYDSLRSAGFDIVILDQRGAGFAKPALRCAETAGAFKEAVSSKLSFNDALTVYHESLTACHKRLLDSNIPLADFDTYQSAQDYLAVIRMLPYNWWGTLATSYATVIAQAMEVIQPRVFDRIVLDSPVAIDFQRPFTFELTEASVQRVLSLCEITRRCNRRHSDIKNKFKQVLARAAEKPYIIPVENVDTGNAELPVDDTTLLDMLMLSAYSNYTLTEIPWAIDQLYKNRPQRLKLMATDYWHYNSDTEFSTALSWTIHCKERQPLEAAYLRLHPQAVDGYSDYSKTAMEQEQVICEEWAVPVSDATVPAKPITTKTFIVAGDLDPVISREDISNAADNFTDREIMILPGTGHSVWFQSECTRRNTVVFFTDTANSVLTNCRDGITRFK